MGREEKEAEKVAAARMQTGGGATLPREVEKEIADAMGLTAQELDAMKKEQERLEREKTKVEQFGEKSLKRPARAGLQEEADGKKSGRPSYAPSVSGTRTTATGETEKQSNLTKSMDKTVKKKLRGADEGVGASMIVPQRRTLSHEGQPPSAGRFGQVGNAAPAAPIDSAGIGAFAVEGPGGAAASIDRAELGEGGNSSRDQLFRGDQSLISAELVTDERLDPDDIREMLRSELQAELRNNIVQAEVLAPQPPSADEEAAAEAPEAEEPKPPPTRRRFCIIGAVLVFIIGAGAATGGALAATGRANASGGDEASDTVGATGPASQPTIAPSGFAPMEPTFEASSSPAMQPSTGEGGAQTSPLPTPFPTPFPTRMPTNKPPTEVGETPQPTESLRPTAAPTDNPTQAPTFPPTTAGPTATPTAAPTAAPTRLETDPPTEAPTVAPTTPITAPPTRSPTASPTDEDIACPAVFDPVCGSDGVTYPNACEANKAGVSFTDGACPSPTDAPTARPTIRETPEPTVSRTPEPTRSPQTPEPTPEPPTEGEAPPTPEDGG